MPRQKNNEPLIASYPQVGFRCFVDREVINLNVAFCRRFGSGNLCLYVDPECCTLLVKNIVFWK